MGIDNVQKLTAKARGGNTLAISILHCKVLDAVYSGGLIAIGPFKVALGLKRMQDKVRYEEVSDCEKCLIGVERCRKQVRNTVPAELLRLLA